MKNRFGAMNRSGVGSSDLVESTENRYAGGSLFTVDMRANG